MERNREMKITRKKEKPEEKVIPEVGDVFTYSQGHYFMIIDPHWGKCAYDHNSANAKDHYFVCLTSGKIYCHNLGCEDTEIINGSFVEEN